MLSWESNKVPIIIRKHAKEKIYFLENNLIKLPAKSTTGNANIEEINIEIPDGEPLILVKPQDVYYNMYRDMLIKAKETRKEALATFLEAKNIKTKYMLDDIDDSEEENEFYNIED